MNSAFYQASTSPELLVDENKKDLFAGEVRDAYSESDLFNEDTFGSGAVEEDWELEHNQFVGLENPIEESKTLKYDNVGVNIPKVASKTSDYDFNSAPVLSPSQLNDEELERSNQELAAAVEELVLNSDQDQDAIDPAIVSLRKQPTKPSVFGTLSTTSQLPSFLTQQDRKNFDNGDLSSLLGVKPVNTLPNGNLQNIWNEGNQVPSNFPLLLNRLNGQHDVPPSDTGPFQDNAILSAIKNDQSSNDSPLYFSNSKPLVLKAEDLEREMQLGVTERVPSPPFGISIPNPNISRKSSDRSLPARSVSPVFGSPSPSTMPIGTPPKHVILDMMNKLEQQQKEQRNQNSPRVTGTSGLVTHPPMQPGISQPRLPVFLNRPPLGGPRLAMSPSLSNMVWPPRPGMPMTQDVINRLGLRMGSPLNSPIGSPHGFPPARLFASNMRPPLIPPHGMGRHPMFRQPMHRMMGPPQRSKPMLKFGPGHLHPEHSKYVRMRQQHQNNRYDRRGYNNQRGQNRDGSCYIGVPGDPFANIMTPKEKDWVIHIQMMALQSDRPEIDDYYYQNFIERRLRDGKLNPNESGKTPRRLITPSKPNADNRKYVPVQFNNSLGKLTTSSVYNPRQIIDIVQAANVEDEAGESNVDTRQALGKRLVVYQKIEKAYDLIVSIEEIHSALITCDGGGNERELISRDFKLKIKLLIDILGFHDTPTPDTPKDSIFQMMKIRKGKKLLARAMDFFSLNDRLCVLFSIFAHLPILIKRDLKDGVLLELYPCISDTISMMDCDLTSESLSKMTLFTLTAAVKDQVGVSIVCKLLCHGHRFLQFKSFQPIWKKFVSDVSNVIVSVANPKEGSRHARPSTPSPLLEEFPDIFEILREFHHTELPALDVLKSSYQRLIQIDSSFLEE